MKAIVIDTETNNVDDPSIAQMAYLPFSVTDKSPQPITFNEMFRPETPLTAGAIAVNGITNASVADCPAYNPETDFPDRVEYIIGHNIDFDAKALKNTSAKRICTLAMTRYFYPKWSGHTLGACVIELFGEAPGLGMVVNAHDAKADTINCAHVLIELIRRIKKDIPDIETLYQVSEHCRIPKIMPISKQYKGWPIQDVPTSFRQWYRNVDNPDPYILKAWSKK